MSTNPIQIHPDAIYDDARLYGALEVTSGNPGTQLEGMAGYGIPGRVNESSTLAFG